MPDKKPSEGSSDRRSSDGAAQAEELTARLERLKQKLDDPDGPKPKARQDPDSAESVHNRAGVAQAFRLSSEFIAGVVAGAGIGYLIDTFFGTSPWGLIIFLMLGFAAAVLNVMRAAGMVAESEMRLKPAHELHKKQQEEETGRGSKK